VNAHARPSLLDSADLRPAAKSSGEIEYDAVSVDAQAPMDLQAARQNGERKIRVYVAADNRMQRESLGRLLVKRGNVEVVGFDMTLTCDAGALVGQGAEVLLLVSQGNVQEDLVAIQRVRAAAASVPILLMGSSKEEGDFLQCVRAGVRGYLWRDASAEDVLNAIRAVHAGEAVCSGALCSALFYYFEGETPELPCASPRQRLGLTRREQQLVPLIAKGFTNKEIANHFCLSEQTVKNHLYHMKHKIGAEDRLNIVQRFRTQGFLLKSSD
jgi:DNA-binding NarL/FixJ family response regulator